MTLRLEDLPPAMRKQVEAKADVAAPKRRTKARGSSTGRCHSCEWTGSFSAWQRHSDSEQHHRFDMDLAQ